MVTSGLGLMRPSLQPMELRFADVSAVKPDECQCQDDLVTVDKVVEMDQGLVSFDRCSYNSWTEYDKHNPAAAPNRLTHEISNMEVCNFMQASAQKPGRFRQWIKQKRAEQFEVETQKVPRPSSCLTSLLAMLWPSAGCQNLSTGHGLSHHLSPVEERNRKNHI